jgi:hypothetical protein
MRAAHLARSTGLLADTPAVRTEEQFAELQWILKDMLDRGIALHGLSDRPRPRARDANHEQRP